jgi:KDO2-lipid IV(A) lauroyltransferase
VVADQAPPKKLKNTYWANFLNQETAFFPSAQDLPKLTQFPVFFFHMKFIHKGQYELEVRKIADPPYEKGSTAVIDKYIEEAQKLVHEDPAGWLWSHKRWKRKRNQEI